MNLPLSLDFSQALIKPTVTPAMRALLKRQSPPDFTTPRCDLEELSWVLKPYQKYKNVIIIANGGSRTSAMAFIGALGAVKGKRFEFLSTMDPSLIERLKKDLKPTDSLVMPISKSGTNVDVLEPLSAFWDRYPVLPVTGEKGSVLKEIAEAKGWDTLVHPEVGGRFSGRTTSAYAPALLAGIDVAELDRGARIAYKTYAYDAPMAGNDALKSAIICYELEKKGHTEIFSPVYSSAYGNFLPLMVQLLHESTGKNEQGQTIYGDMGPESQHHTNQRFFGGRRNVMGMFVVVEDLFTRKVPAIKIPSSLKPLILRDGVLGDLDALPFGKGLQFDYEGTRDEATTKKIPHFTITIKDVSPYSVGFFLSFLHYFTVYSALLRNQNPFDQPEVEGAKARSFEKLKGFRVRS